jgi:hypothetical protein
MIRRKGPIVLGRSVPACLLLVALSCQPAQTHSDSSEAPDRAANPALARDLSQDESAGGHTLQKHVGQTDEQLRERLRRDRHIAAASSWTNRLAAEQAVAAALEQNRDKIARWLNRSGGHPNLVVDYDGDPQHPIGRSWRRGAGSAEPCAHATIVLKWSAPSTYYVLTSYPECRE